MWGFNPRISAWSNAVPMCPPACTNPRAETPLRYCGVDWPSHISGASRHQGSITKTGNCHIRRVLVESAWAYRYAPAASATGSGV